MTASIKSIIATLAIIIALPVSATRQAPQTAASRDYDAVAAKAQRFIQYQEWANAAAMLEIMLEDSATIASTYGKAIAVAGMRALPDYQMSLLERAQSSLIPMDTIFANVKVESFNLGHSSLYEHFLQLVRARQPWLARSIDKHLLRYYVFRANGPAIIQYSKIMLSGAPDNADYLSNLAYGYLLEGQDNESISTLRLLIDRHPYNYQALLTLGNYYNLNGDSHQALHFLQRANDITPTPYVTDIIHSLTTPK